MAQNRYIYQKYNHLHPKAESIDESVIDALLAAYIIRKGCDISGSYLYEGYYYVYNPHNPDGLEYDRFKLNENYY